MRVAIVYDCLYPWSRGGGERLYRAMADTLAAAGHDVEYVTRRHWEGEAVVPGVTVTPIWEGAIHRADGTRIPSSALGFARAVRRHLRGRRGEHDLVIASALPVLTLIGARLGLGRGTPLVGDWLEVWSWAKWREYSGALVGTVATVLQRLGTGTTPVHSVDSGFTGRRLEAIAPRADLVVLGLLDIVERPDRIRSAATPPTAVFLGRLIPDKRADRIPAAIAVARERIPTLRAIIAGGGPDRDRIAAEIERVGLGHAIDLPGFVDDETAARIVGEAAVLVHPSVREGFGLVVAEASAAGVPVVVVDGPDNAAVELVDPGVNGIVAADIDALAAAIVEVVGAGASMRESSLNWFEQHSRTDRLDLSLQRVIELATSRHLDR